MMKQDYFWLRASGRTRYREFPVISLGANERAARLAASAYIKYLMAPKFRLGEFAIMRLAAATDNPTCAAALEWLRKEHDRQSAQQMRMFRAGHSLKTAY